MIKISKRENFSNSEKHEPTLVHFSWGGTTHEWEEEADQIMHYLQDKLDSKEDDIEKEKKIQYASQKQYWLDYDK
ncbi:hypothetical protein [Caminicella sporogenes]|uniref:hypothetical protein n=1 Tax=Caminicella sporogenes TaxID=166485 RepID=UPI000E7328F4|nr:hypothetical protein [Caminicella sporogenes]RKD27631.1 hypothetical protein BET04_00750 [Caminicella sporogenes]